MKKVFSIFAALVVAMTMMVSCGAVKSAKDGVVAGEAFAKAFASANGDVQQISNAYQNVAVAAQAYANDPKESTYFMTGVLQSCEEKSAECAGTFLAAYASACSQAGVDGNAMALQLAEFSENKAAVTQAYQQVLAAWAAEAQAAMEAAEAEAEDEEGEYEEEE